MRESKTRSPQAAHPIHGPSCQPRFSIAYCDRILPVKLLGQPCWVPCRPQAYCPPEALSSGNPQPRAEKATLAGDSPSIERHYLRYISEGRSAGPDADRGQGTVNESATPRGRAGPATRLPRNPCHACVRQAPLQLSGWRLRHIGSGPFKVPGYVKGDGFRACGLSQGLAVSGRVRIERRNTPTGHPAVSTSGTDLPCRHPGDGHGQCNTLGVRSRRGRSYSMPAPGVSRECRRICRARC